jgi:hypothetical protein
MERHHHLQTTGLNLKEVEFLDGCADGAAANLFDNSNTVIRIDDLITDVEAAIATNHEGTPTKAAGQRKLLTSILAE